jgi:hypothetical protein
MAPGPLQHSITSPAKSGIPTLQSFASSSSKHSTDCRASWQPIPKVPRVSQLLKPAHFPTLSKISHFPTPPVSPVFPRPKLSPRRHSEPDQDLEWRKRAKKSVSETDLEYESIPDFRKEAARLRVKEMKMELGLKVAS